MIGEAKIDRRRMLAKQLGASISFENHGLGLSCVVTFLTPRVRLKWFRESLSENTQTVCRHLRRSSANSPLSKASAAKATEAAPSKEQSND